MERDGTAKRCKVVWTEGSEVHSVMARSAGEENGFLKFILSNGAALCLHKSAVIKIEEVPL